VLRTSRLIDVVVVVSWEKEKKSRLAMGRTKRKKKRDFDNLVGEIATGLPEKKLWTTSSAFPALWVLATGELSFVFFSNKMIKKKTNFKQQSKQHVESPYFFFFFFFFFVSAKEFSTSSLLFDFSVFFKAPNHNTIFNSKRSSLLPFIIYFSFFSSGRPTTVVKESKKVF
jgi:hypothetical protein